MRVTIDVASISVVASFISMLLAFFAIWYMRNVEKRTGDLLNRFSEYFGDIRAKTERIGSDVETIIQARLVPEPETPQEEKARKAREEEITRNLENLRTNSNLTGETVASLTNIVRDISSRIRALEQKKAEPSTVLLDSIIPRLSQLELQELEYLGQHGQDSFGLGHREHFQGSFISLRDKGLVQQMGGSNQVFWLTTRGREVFRTLFGREPLVTQPDIV